MSSTETSAFGPDNSLEIDTERPILRSQRPPPPPPPTEPESTSPSELTAIPTEPEVILPSPEISNESVRNIEDNYSSLLTFQFNDLFDSFDYATIRNKILTRQMITCPFNTVLWRIFLHCLPRDSSQWNLVIDASRDEYAELEESYLLDLRKIREHNGDAKHLNHPLSQEENSLWNQYYVYEELKENIYQDVIRTCQELSFFRQKHILDLLLKVLYIHSRHFGESLPYRQGMHEILAVIVYLIHSESLTINRYSEANEMMKKLYDPEYLAHDSYAMYVKIMEHLQQFYDFKPNNVVARKVGHVIFHRLHDAQMQLNDTVMRVNSIFERLKEYDIALYEKLQDLNIEPTVYGIRWLRLLFGREIPFGSISSLWTVIFCYDECFAFVDYFFLALLMEIGRIFKLHGIYENSFCLQYLMQPNTISDVETIINKALILEKLARTKELSRSTLNLSLSSAQSRLSTLGTPKPISPVQNYSQNPLIDSIKSSTLTTPFVFTSQIEKNFPSSKDSEMNLDPGKETRQRFDDNTQIQKHCVDYMNKFINRIRNRVDDLETTNEEVLIQLNGLEQIANVLEGTLTFDDNSLQALANYKSKSKPPIEQDTGCID